MSAETSKKPGFSSYGLPFQEKIVQALMLDHRWAQQMSEVIRMDYFEKRHLQFIAECFFDYYSKFKAFPSFEILVNLAKEKLRAGPDQILCSMIVELLKKVKTNPDPGDLPYVKEKALDFCRRQAMKDALEQSIELINVSKYDQVVSTMRSAIAVGTLPSVGHKFFDEIEARMAPITRNVIATGIPELDAKDIMQGGLGRGELGVIVAPTGVGKSHGLVCLGANAIRQGKTVVHYTFELSEQYTGIRYDSNFTQIESNSVLSSKEKVKVLYKEQKNWGRLFIKEYPSNACSVLTMRNHLEKLEIAEGVKPDVILVDYADIMRSTRAYDAPRHELKLIYEELRGLGQELGIPVWTASQANRDASKAEIVGLENMSEAYAKAMVADFVMSFSRKPMEKSKGIGRLFIAKNRMGRDGLVWPIKIDTARSIIEVSSPEPLTLEDEARGDRDRMKDAVRTKWEQVKADRELNAQKIS